MPCNWQLNLTVNLPVCIGPSGWRAAAAAQTPCTTAGANRAFDQRVFVTSRRDTGGLLPSLYVGGRAGGMS